MMKGWYLGAVYSVKCSYFYQTFTKFADIKTNIKSEEIIGDS